MTREPYAIEFNGTCMGGLIEHGSILHAVPGEEIRPMDLVSVVLGGFTGPWANFINSISDDGFAGLVKVFLGVCEANGEPVGLFGQLNPPTIAPIPMSSIAAVDKIDFCRECLGTDRDALALMAPFAGASTQKEVA
ncbi:hypothetical protein GOA97_19460 [Sinorhizobium meliloti]|nr:hypothetical protein [Sinorhizobium meliloti]MDW9656633.1 hypothetical protein [Sinorhizobium meliloti]MDW9916443.1 hypothetical protein [Sinorhizobium meliloti]MDW9939568.1 hypothetical protein [Sinorhizobium meliloti]MDW9945975.1 hypothetical protein [Sinorhizobium meliloti]